MTVTALVASSDLLDRLGGTTKHVLTYSIFKLGGLAITPVFLLKAAAFIILLVAISRVVQKLLLSRLLQHVHIADSAKFAIGRFITYLLFFGGIFIGLQSLGVNLSSLVVFGGAVGVGVGLGLQNVVSNFVAGLILLIEQPVRIGDRIEIDKTLGDVVKIAARSTWIRTNDNVVIIVPNSEFINESVINWTANDPNVRIRLPVGVSYDADPHQVRQILLDAAAAHPDVLKEPAPRVFFESYGDNSINFLLAVWTGTLSHKPIWLKSDLYFTLFDKFKEAGIELPFPQRDLHIRSSDIPLPFSGKQPADDRNANAGGPDEAGTV